MTKKNFLITINEKADALGVSLTVEHLLPGLQKIITSKLNQPDKLQVQIRLLFRELRKLISYLSQSEITVGYNGIRDYLIPIFAFFFTSDTIEEATRTELKEEVI